MHAPLPPLAALVDRAVHRAFAPSSSSALSQAPQSVPLMEAVLALVEDWGRARGQPFRRWRVGRNVDGQGPASLHLPVRGLALEVIDIDGALLGISTEMARARIRWWPSVAAIHAHLEEINVDRSPLPRMTVEEVAPADRGPVDPSRPWFNALQEHLPEALNRGWASLHAAGLEATLPPAPPSPRGPRL